MSTLTFDTLKFANRLKNAGIPSIHAEAEADALSEVFETNLSELATKEDLRHEIGDLLHEMKELETSLRHEMKELETGLRHEMKEVETGLRHEIKELDLRIHGEMLLMKWMLGLLLAGVASLILKSFFSA